MTVNVSAAPVAVGSASKVSSKPAVKANAGKAKNKKK
jgi:hypothetical protein